MRMAITAMGMMSSVGRDAETACASIRAGLQRPRELHYFGVLDSEEQESKPLVARPIHGVTNGFIGMGLWLRLAIAACRDMQSRVPALREADSEFWSRTGLLAITPAIDPLRFAEDEVISAPDFAPRYVQALAGVLNWPLRPANMQVLPLGHAGIMEAIIRAERAIAAKRLDRIIVVAADSYLDPLSLDWIDANDRLKTDDNPFGLIPGEAGCCLMLEAAQAAAGLAELDVAVTAQQSLDGAERRNGVGLADAIAKSLAAAGAKGFSGMAIIDLNGEPWRAQEWGAARVRLGGQVGDDVRWTFPADSLGDVGAAAGAVGVCMAVAALQRGYAGDSMVLVTASSDSGLVGSVCVSQPA